jgi:hypothetical protein
MIRTGMSSRCRFRLIRDHEGGDWLAWSCCWNSIALQSLHKSELKSKSKSTSLFSQFMMKKSFVGLLLISVHRLGPSLNSNRHRDTQRPRILVIRMAVNHLRSIVPKKSPCSVREIHCHASSWYRGVVNSTCAINDRTTALSMAVKSAAWASLVKSNSKLGGLPNANEL